MLAQNMTLDTFVMALACFLTNNNNPMPVYLNSVPNFQLISSTIGCQMQKHDVISMRMRDLTMLKLQQDLTIKELEYKVENLNATRHQFNPLLHATVQKLQNQNQVQATQIDQYVAELKLLKEKLKNQEFDTTIKANQYQAEVATLKEIIRNAGNSSQSSQDVQKLETEVKLLREQISNHEDSLYRQQNQIERYESEIDNLKSTISEHDENNRPYGHDSIPDVCDNLMRLVSNQDGRLNEFKDKIEEIRVIIGNRLMGPAPKPARPPMPHPDEALSAMLRDCNNRVQSLEYDLNNIRNNGGDHYGGGHHGGGHQGGGHHGGGHHGGGHHGGGQWRR